MSQLQSKIEDIVNYQFLYIRTDRYIIENVLRLLFRNVFICSITNFYIFEDIIESVLQ